MNQLLFIPNRNRYIKINFGHVMYLKAAANYTEFRLHDNSSIMACKHLAYCFKKLNSPFFIRVNRSYAVNIHYVTTIVVEKQLVLQMNNDHKIKVSAKYAKAIKQHFIL